MRWLAFLLIACGGQAAGPEATTEAPPQRASQDDEVDPTPAEPALDPSPEPALRVWAERDDDGGATLHVQNRGSDLVRLRTAVGLELKAGDAWTDVPIEMALRLDCATPVDDCTELAPGAELIPPRWTGDRGDAQCDCERCVPLEAGEVRFVLKSCAPEGTRPHEVRSEPLVR